MEVGEVYNGWEILEFFNQGKEARKMVKVKSKNGEIRSFRLHSFINNTTPLPGEMIEQNHNHKYDTKHILYRKYMTIKSICNKTGKILGTEFDTYDKFYEYWIQFYEEDKCLVLINNDGDYIKENMHFQTKHELNIKTGYLHRGRKGTPQSTETKNKIRQTCIERYGTASPQKLKSIQDKTKNTVMKKYGAKHYTQTQEYKDKSKETCLKKYGTEHQSQSDEFKNKLKQRSLESGRTNTYNGRSIRVIAEELGIARTTLEQRAVKYGYEVAISMPKKYTEIEYIVSNMLDELSLKYDKEKIIGNYRADFVIHEFNTIIECDGLYWHSDERQPNKYYHRDKQIFYKQQGFKSIFFREDEILNKSHIIKSMIAHRCKLSRPIYARKCVIEELPHKEVKQFFIDYHLMGNGSGKGIVLKYEGEIVAACQIVQRDYVDISRFCTKPNTHVIGGFSKILSFIDKKYNKDIHTFIDGRYGDGEYLKKLGFELKNKDISFKWVDGIKTYHRLKFPSNTGYENGLYKIWDCGQYKYIKKAVTSTA